MSLCTHGTSLELTGLLHTPPTTTVHLLQLFLCQLLSLLLIVLFILFHNCVNFKLFDLLLIVLYGFVRAKIRKYSEQTNFFAVFLNYMRHGLWILWKKWNSHGIFICFCSKRKRKCLLIRKFLRMFAAIIHYAKK